MRHVGPVPAVVVRILRSKDPCTEALLAALQNAELFVPVGVGQLDDVDQTLQGVLGEVAFAILEGDDFTMVVAVNGNFALVDGAEVIL